MIDHLKWDITKISPSHHVLYSNRYVSVYALFFFSAKIHGMHLQRFCVQKPSASLLRWSPIDDVAEMIHHKSYLNSNKRKNLIKFVWKLYYDSKPHLFHTSNNCFHRHWKWRSILIYSHWFATTNINKEKEQLLGCVFGMCSHTFVWLPRIFLHWFHFSEIFELTNVHAWVKKKVEKKNSNNFQTGKMKKQKKKNVCVKTKKIRKCFFVQK